MKRNFLVLALSSLCFSAFAQMSMMPPRSQNPDSDRLKVETALKDCRELAGAKEDTKEFNDCMLSKGFMKPPSATPDNKATSSPIPGVPTLGMPK